MKNSKTIFWLLIIIGTLGLFAGIFAYSNGKDFSTYFWGGLSGITLIGTALINQKEKNNNA